MLIPPSYFFKAAYVEAWGPSDATPPGAVPPTRRRPPPSRQWRRLALTLAALLERIAAALRRHYAPEPALQRVC
jgi:hypothetical protein